MSPADSSSASSHAQLRIGIGLMLITGFFFGLLGALSKALSASIPPMEIVFFRGAVNAALIAPWMFKEKIRFIGNNRRILLSRSISGYISVSLYFYAISKLVLADAVILNSTSAIFVPVLSSLLLFERVRRSLYLYLIIALCGAALIVKPSGEIMNLSAVAGLLSGVFAALSYVSVKKLQETDSYFTIVFSFTAFSALASLLIFGRTFVLPDLYTLGLLFIMGLSGTLGQLTMTRAYYYGPAALINPFQFSTFLFSLLFGALVWGEFPDIYALVGALLIISVGVRLLSYSREAATVTADE